MYFSNQMEIPGESEHFLLEHQPLPTQKVENSHYKVKEIELAFVPKISGVGTASAVLPCRVHFLKQSSVPFAVNTVVDKQWSMRENEIVFTFRLSTIVSSSFCTHCQCCME